MGLSKVADATFKDYAEKSLWYLSIALYNFLHVHVLKWKNSIGLVSLIAITNDEAL